MLLWRPPRAIDHGPSAPSHFRIGGFTDFGGRSTVSKQLLENLVRALRRLGWDAFLSGDPRSVAIAGARLNPRQMTEVLERTADLSVYVGWAEGRGDGWVSELTAMQLAHPERAPRRLVALEEGYPLASVLDPDKGGYLLEPPVRIEWWWGEENLRDLVVRTAFQVLARGDTP